MACGARIGMLIPLLVALSTTAATNPASTFHCPDESGRLIGLAADGHYSVRPPADAPPNGDNPETWTVRSSGDGPCQNSFTGTYMQVLPDDRDSYHDIHGLGSFTMTGLEFRLRISEAGLHTLYLRWTGGDTVGGGDSLYAVLYNSSQGFVAGVPTLKPKVEEIGETAGKYSGCCYDMVTHACPCCEARWGWDDSNKPPGCAFWVSAQTGSSRYGMTCASGHGELESVRSPRWYLFAGQAYGNVMDFDAEPWDATCEAEGTGTADTGLDVAQWHLTPGDYSLVIYPREDGTAVDAFYMSTPSNDQPPNGLRLQLGSSTVSNCPAVTPTPQTAPPSMLHRRALGSCDAGGVHGVDASIIGYAIGVLMSIGGVMCCLGICCCTLCVHCRLRKGWRPLPWTPGGMGMRARTASALAASDAASTVGGAASFTSAYRAPVAGVPTPQA